MNRGFSRTSGFEVVGDPSAPDIVYYNASIVNNQTEDTLPNAYATADPQIRFIETRDTAIVKDASQYQFSIVRFVLNGANRDLPLFIPQIQQGTGQTDVNLTEYAVGISFNGIVDLSGTLTNILIAPPVQYIEYEPETINQRLAPIPRPPCSINYVGIWNGTTTYIPGQIIGLPNLGTGGINFYQAIPNASPNLNQSPNISPLFWSVVSSELGQPQDLSSRYYWVYTIQHWVDLVNEAYDQANIAVWTTYQSYVSTLGALPSYATYASWTAVYPPPKMYYDPPSGLFSMIYPSAYLPQDPLATTAVVQMSAWMNTNLWGMFEGFPFQYVNDKDYQWLYTPATAQPFPTGFAYKMVVESLGWGQNKIVVPDLSGQFIQMYQDIPSTSTLWSPIDSIVFTSNLLPLKNEQNAPPNSLGSGNLGTNSTSQSAFAPIITDIALDLSADPNGYKKMIYYAPAAEYRMASFQNSKVDIRSIDIQVWWKNRLDNQLYPLQMYNLSSVSFKLMFRKKPYPGKGDATE
jgi:hypothetical protein